MPEARCRHCQGFFEVPDALVGGIANCAVCGKATEVEGLRDPLWRMWQVAAAAGVAVVMALVATFYGWGIAILVGAALAGILLLVTSCM